MSDEKNNPFSVRMEPEDKEKLLKMIQESGSSGSREFMKTLMSAYELNKVKVEVPEASESIVKLEELTQLINDYFVNMSKQIKTTKESMNLQYTKDMEIYKEKVEALKTENAKINQELDTIRLAYNNTCSDNEELNKHLSQLEEINQDKTSLVEEYKGKNDMLLSQLKQFEKYPEQLETTKGLFTDAQARIIEISNNLKDKEAAAINLTNEINELKDKHNIEVQKLSAEKDEVITELKEKHKETIEELQDKHKDSLKQCQDKAELEKEKALLHLQQEMQSKIQSIQDNYNKTIEEYQQKYRTLLGEIEQSKTNIKKTPGTKGI